MLISLISVIYCAKSRFTHKEANFLPVSITNMAKEINLDAENTTCKEIKKFDLGPVLQSPC